MPFPRRRRAAAPPAAQTSFAVDLFAETPETAEPKIPGAGDLTVRETVPAPALDAAASSPAAAALLADLLPVYAVKLVQTDWVPLHGQAPVIIHSPGDVARLLFKYLAGVDREHFVVLLLNTKGRLIGVSTVSVGDLSSTLVHPREVYKPAILANAASIIVAHNHPSGDPSPSPEDVQVTRRLAEAGEVLGIDVLDHIVLGAPPPGIPNASGRWVSLSERGLHVPNKGWKPAP